MKKVIIVIVLLLLTGCVKDKPKVIEKEEIKEEVIEEKYVDNNPITIGIYENDISLLKEYKLKRVSGNETIFSF